MLAPKTSIPTHSHSNSLEAKAARRQTTPLFGALSVPSSPAARLATNGLVIPTLALGPILAAAQQAAASSGSPHSAGGLGSPTGMSSLAALAALSAATPGSASRTLLRSSSPSPLLLSRAARHISSGGMNGGLNSPLSPLDRGGVTTSPGPSSPAASSLHTQPHTHAGAAWKSALARIMSSSPSAPVSPSPALWSVARKLMPSLSITALRTPGLQARVAAGLTVHTATPATTSHELQPHQAHSAHPASTAATTAAAPLLAGSDAGAGAAPVSSSSSSTVDPGAASAVVLAVSQEAADPAAAAAVSSAPLCEICDDVAAEVHCAQCRMYLCVQAGKGCDAEMHRPATKQAHVRTSRPIA